MSECLQILNKEYKYYKDFLKDLSVTEEELISLIGYEGLPTRYITRHPSCTEKVLDAMKYHEKWYIRCIGQMHFKLPVETVVKNALVLIREDVHGAARREAYRQLKNFKESSDDAYVVSNLEAIISAVMNYEEARR